MAALTAGLLALSAGASYLSQRKQGESTASALDQNAGLADERAADAIARGTEAAARQQQGTAQLIGSQRSGYASQGVQVDSGSAATTAADTAQLGELDRLQIEHNAAREAYGFKADAANQRAQGEQVRQSSRAAARGTLLTAASQLYAMKPPGTPGSTSMIKTRGWGG